MSPTPARRAGAPNLRPVPDWQPNWDDVVFDYAAADVAITQCNQAAGALDTATTGVGAAVTALGTDAEWRGNYRLQFDQAVPRIPHDASSTQFDLRQLAQRIADAAAAAKQEQAFRESERARWHQLQAAEDEARRRRWRNIPE